MAIPILPILVIAGVVMFAGGAGKKAGRRATGNGAAPAQTKFGMLKGGATVHVPIGVTFGDPDAEAVFGAVCGPAAQRQTGVWSAYAQNGECLVFWDADTDAAMTYYIQQAFEESGYTLEEVCAPDPGWEGDPFDPNPEVAATWIPNPFQIELLKQALAKSYPQIPPDILPPPPALGPGDPSIPDYVEIVWVFAMSILLREVCGYVPVS
jgi:hypothetical protein